MTPKEKSKSMVKEYYSNLTDVLMNEEAKEFAIICSLVCVDEIIKSGILLAKHELEEDRLTDKHLCYWQDVKHELSLLQLTPFNYTSKY